MTPTNAARFAILLLAASVAACGWEQGTFEGPSDDADLFADPTGPREPATEPGDVLYVGEGDELDDGVRISGELPFRSFSLVVTAPVDSRFSFRRPLESGGMSAWQDVVIDEDLGLYRSGHQVLPAAVDFAELRATAGASFVEVTLYEGAWPMDDDDPGDAAGPTDEADDARDAAEGMWTPPYATWLLGQEQYLPYSGAVSCTGSLTPGARALGEHLVEEFGATSFGGYNCRTIGGSSTLSVHSEGRAIDVYVPMDGSGPDAADNDLGDPVANWLIENAELIGISYVIWDRASWGAHRSGDKHRSYGGAHPHDNHLHIELSWAGAAQATAWFDDPDSATEPGGPGGSDAPSGDRYMVGDWDGDGRDNLAVRRGNDLYLDTDFDGLADITHPYGDGDAEDEYLTGDWDGQGRDHPAVRRGDTVLMDTNFDAVADLEQTYGDGDAEDEYLVGDWDGDGVDDLAVRRGDTVHMDTDGDGLGDLVQLYGDGAAEDEYLVGDWDGDGRDNLAVRRGDIILMDTDFSGGADLVRLYGNGAAEDEYLVGDWDGDGVDDLAVRRGDTVLMDTDQDGVADITQVYGDG